MIDSNEFLLGLGIAFALVMLEIYFLWRFSSSWFGIKEMAAEILEERSKHSLEANTICLKHGLQNYDLY